MQQVNVIGYRLGSTVGWNVTDYNKILPEIELQKRVILQQMMIKQGQFLLVNYSYNHRGVMFGVVTYYRYYQRSRLPAWMTRRLRRREGAMAPFGTRVYMLHKLDVAKRSTYKDFRRRLKLVFPKAGLKDRSLESRRSWKLRGWIDLEISMLRVSHYWPFRRHKHLVRQAWENWVSRGEFRAHNILALVDAVNPVAATKHYMFKKFNRLLYQHDLLQVLLLATKLNSAPLVAHTILIGLERHARKRMQIRWLKMFKIIMAHIMQWEFVENEILWRFSIFGKLDAKMRRRHFKMRVGFIRYQHIDWAVSSARAVSRTRFGTSSIRIWMRNFLN